MLPLNHVFVKRANCLTVFGSVVTSIRFSVDFRTNSQAFLTFDPLNVHHNAFVKSDYDFFNFFALTYG
jgi:hypothetical protein